MGKVNRYLATGFICIDEIISGDIATAKAAVVSIAKGDVLHDVDGYASNAVTAFTHELLGVAIATVDNSDGSVGDKNVQYIRFQAGKRFIVAVEATALVAQADVGNLVDLQSVNTVDEADIVSANPGFRIEEIDVSADAIAANTYGFVVGRFGIDS